MDIIIRILPYIIALIFLLHYKNLSEKDGMTGTYNKYWFMAKKNSKLVRLMKATHKNYKKTFGLFIVDLDNFKEINDTHGHFYGDKIIKETAFTIKKAIGRKDILARIGGDEFCIIIRDLENSFQVKNISLVIAERVCDAVGSTISISGAIYKDTQSISVEKLINLADLAMYKVKKEKKIEKCKMSATA